jgi:hypothetical protein
MASHKKDDEREEFQPRVNIPAQEEEADIIEEVGAEEDEESGELVADEDKVRKIGAADPATVREDRRLRSVANKKRQGKKNVGFGTTDPLVVYETLLKTWAPDSIDITFKRLSGSQITQMMIRSRPRSRTELYEAFMNMHGQSEAAEYEVRFHDSSGHQWRGQGRITMPDTRPRGQQNGNGHYPQQQQPQASTQPMQPASPFALLQEALDTVERLRGMQPAQSTAPQQATPSASQLLQDALDTVQRLQGMQPTPQSNEMARLVDALQRVTGRGAPQQPQMAAPIGPQLPTTPAPPGYRYTWLPESGCCVLEPVRSAMPIGREPQPRQFRRDAPYYPQGEPQERDRYERDPYARPQGPPDQLREVRKLMVLRKELDSLFGGGERRNDGYDIDGAPEQDPDSPVIIERTTDVELVRNREDGSIRGWDTLLINLPGMIKKGGEYIDKISKTAVAERQRRERAQVREQLPPGYAYVEVPAEEVRQAQAPQPREDLPPPPTHVPPPIREEEEEPEPEQQRGWDEDL